MDKEQIAKFEEKLKSLGIPSESVHVFGTARINIHIKCLSETTARKWVSTLDAIFPKRSILNMRPTVWEAKENKGTCLLPTMREGWAVGLIA